MSSYRLNGEESIDQGVKRILDELGQEALRMLQDPEAEGVIESIHGTRKICKKARGLLRLVRPVLGKEYRLANELFRDAARCLDPIRDPHAVVGTFDALIAASPERLPAGGLLEVRTALAGRAAEATARILGPESDRLDEARGLIEAAISRHEHWKIPRGFKAAGKGVHKTYRRGKKAMAAAAKSGTPEDFHEWRKRTKYLWYQVRLIEGAAPAILSPLSDRLHNLSDALGDAHDLAVFADLLPNLEAPDDQRQAVAELAGSMRADLEARALGLGARLFAETPSAFVDRLRGYWKAWQEGEEPAAGEIGDLFGTSDDLDTMTRAQLYQMAKQHDVPRRSTMDGPELAAALRSAGATKASG